MTARRPDRESIPPVARYRMRHTKTGRIRFTSHRDFQRALERALRRARVPMAYSAGFSPHPRISYANAAPTGAASLAEYVEIAVLDWCDPLALRRELDEALPAGLDIADVVPAHTPDLVARLAASVWRVALPGAEGATVQGAWERLAGAGEVLVSRMAKSGMRTFDVRAALLAGRVGGDPADWPDALADTGAGADAQVTVLLEHQVPMVRPDDVVAALGVVAGFTPPRPPVLTRLWQGPLPVVEPGGTFPGPDQWADPLEPDRVAARVGIG